ncbi:MAG: SpoIIE family protein phosphatase [Brevinematales bacterium]|nr:SpoIIE family protein phosphatase [Brevinematales bacterium]
MNLRLFSFIVASCFNIFLVIQSIVFIIFFSGYRNVIKYSSLSLIYILLIGIFNFITNIIGIYISFEKNLSFFYILKTTTAIFSLIFLVYLMRNMLVSLKDQTFVETDGYKEKTNTYLINFTILSLVFIVANFLYALFLTNNENVYRILSLVFLFFLAFVVIIEIIEYRKILSKEKGKISEINLMRYRTIFIAGIIAIILGGVDILFIVIRRIDLIILFGSMFAYGTIILSVGLSLNFIYEYMDILVRSSEINKKLSELNSKMMDDIRTAQSLQISLLPIDKQKIIQNYIDMEISYMPMQSVGGDYYDFYQLDNKRLLFFLGDASGHGIYAAMIWAILKVEIEELIEEKKFTDLGNSFFILNQRLTRVLENTYSYATLFSVLLDLEAQKLTYISAGHIDQIYYDYSEKKIQFLRNKNPIIGTFKNATFTTDTVSFNNGDVLIMYSDGIVEGINPEGEQLGRKRLMEIVEKTNLSRSAAEILGEILIHLEEFFEGTLQKDDRTLMVIKI